MEAVYVATTNAGKFAELRMMFAAEGWHVEQFAQYRDVSEGETSYAANAALKAVALREQLAAVGIIAPTLGDDSGLEVRALSDRPGVLSARYGGRGISWLERRQLLLQELSATQSTNRAARFVCALHYIDLAGKAFSVECEVSGSIAHSDVGTGGFSYDSIFVYEPFERTFAQLSAAAKNGVSHRGRAVACLLHKVRADAATGKPQALGEGSRLGM